MLTTFASHSYNKQVFRTKSNRRDVSRRWTSPTVVIGIVSCYLLCLDAVPSAQSVLPRATPMSRAIASERITALAGQRRFDDALATYDGYVALGRRPDVALLKPIARALLKETARSSQSDAVLVAMALERLAREGDREAMASLHAASTAAGLLTSPEALAPTLCLARLGDVGATAKVVRLLGLAPVDGKVQAIQYVQEANLRTEAQKILNLLDDPDPHVRGAAARALGALEYREAVPQLRRLFEREGQLIRLFSAIALRRLGETVSRDVVSDSLKSSVPEVRLLAASGLKPAEAREWTPYVKDLLNDPSEAIRLQAAELLSCCDKSTARSVFAMGLRSANPIIRAEAARLLEFTGMAQIEDVRGLLGDDSATIRLYGSGIALQLATALGPGR